MPTKALAEALLEAKKMECESYDGSKFFGKVKEKNGRWCISGRCNACESKWHDDLVDAAKQECCGRGSEPEPDRGVCLNPKEDPDKGIGSSALYLLPKCTGNAPDYESGSFCKPPPSSSSSDKPSSSSSSSSSNAPSSSSESPPSSSSSLLACFKERQDAQREKESLELNCLAGQGSPDFGIDDRNCLWGHCDRPSSSSSEQSSSSEEASSSSSSSDDGGNACLVSASKSYLQKPVNYYDDWVYIGKESYGSKHVARNSLKPGSKFFDVLGRAYDKMKAKIKYYVFKDAVERDEFDVPLEFEVHARIIKDSDGNDIQVFVKEDKSNGLRRDSSFYWDGSWEVFDFEKSTNKMSLKNHSGSTSLRKYDSNDHLLENYLIDEKGDTLISEQYEWKNGRLVRMIENGMERAYIYGNKITDTVHVVPSDEGIRFHSGYNKSVGKMPSEGDPMYKYFTLDPYGYTYYDKENERVVYSTSNIFVLSKLPASGAPNYFCQEINDRPRMPAVECIRYTKEYVLREAKREYPYPNKKDTILYGESHADPDTTMSCECIDGKYHVKYSDTTTNEYIQVMKSGWRYNMDWKEYCWTKEEMQNTYDHEVMHIKNARDKVRELSGKYFKEIIFDTEHECRINGVAKFLVLEKAWGNWYQMEQGHKGKKWRGVTYGQYRAGVQCPN